MDSFEQGYHNCMEDMVFPLRGAIESAITDLEELLMNNPEVIIVIEDLREALEKSEKNK